MIKATVLFLLILGFWWSLRSLEQRSLYFPTKEFDAVPQTYGFRAEEVWLTSAEGRRVNGWYLPVSGKTATTGLTVLLSHGNAGNISHRLDKAARLHKLGLNVFLYDYAGYGKSEGIPSETATYADAEAAYRYLNEQRGLKSDKIVLYGESLGCAVSTELALRHPTAGLILESPFTSTVDMARRVFPWLPVKLIVRYRYDNLSKIGKLRMPLLILHAPRDEIVPFEMGRRLYAAAPDPKQFVELAGGHNEGYIDSGAIYTNAISEFVHRITAL